MTAAIETENLCKLYRGRKGRHVEALKNLNLEIYKGEVFGFLGHNGAGKSTTMKILMGLIFPTSGSFRINGERADSWAYRKAIGYLPENPAFHEYLTGEEVLAFAGEAFGMAVSAVRSKSERLLKSLDLSEARKRPVRGYSKGMVQRLGLAQCLLHDPDILILDEPMSGLDPLGRIMVRDMILGLKDQGKCVFMSTHILNDVETICDRVGIIVRGQMRLVESLDNIVRKGIRGYTVTFSSLSPHMKASLALLSGGHTRPESEKTYYVGIENFEDVLSRAAADEGTSLQLIEPVRRHLEDLFTELAHEE
jgi:ABC-2 type transport system ATP-binding protein